MLSPAPKRVLLTADAVGGVWTHALDLARGLAEVGVAVTLAVLGPKPGRGQRDAAAIPGVDLAVTGLPLDWDMALGPASIRATGFAIAALARGVGADLVHLNSPSLAAFAEFPAPVVGGCHSCLATWWQAVKGEAPMPANFAWRRDLLHAGYRRCRALVAPSRSFAEATQACYGLGQAPQVVHNGRSGIAAGQGEPERSVFTAGRLWDPGKNLAVLARAASFVDAPIQAAGPLRSPHGESLRLDGLQLLGEIGTDAVARHLARRPVFVSTARYEPFGLAVLEAALAGCALVLADIPSFRELWDGAATFVPPSDEHRLAAALNALIDDPVARSRAGAAAAARAGRYTVDGMLQGMLSVYGEALGVQAVA